MSYCRFSEGDLYLYPSGDGRVNCCACRSAPKVPTIWTKGGVPFAPKACSACGGKGCDDCMMHGDASGMTYAEAIKHVEQHIAAGHSVPAGVIEDLKRDQAAEAE